MVISNFEISGDRFTISSVWPEFTCVVAMVIEARLTEMPDGPARKRAIHLLYMLAEMKGI